MGQRREPFLVESLPAIIERVALRRAGSARGNYVSSRPLVPIQTAIADLRGYLGKLRSESSRSELAFEQIEPVCLRAAAD
jgi:hypothetical protein